MIRASMCRSFVMMPDWLPVKLIASPPSSRIASDRSAIEMRSPADRSMSNSRRSGFGDTFFARDNNSSVVSPIAETTTTTSCPARFVRITRSATVRILSTSATLLPPYFWTTIGTFRLRVSRDPGCGTRDPAPGTRIPDPASRIPDPG